jgi:hypothetical protein
VPTATASKKRQQFKPITYDELMGNAGMSGFVSFLESPAPLPPVVADEPFEPVRRRQGRIRRATMVEDGHSLAEQAVYEALWKSAAPIDELAGADRTIRIGYHRLAHMTRLSWVSVKANLQSLEKKLAIEVIGSENSATREGKHYLVYARPAILERRKRAGLLWFRRTRGVELLTSPLQPVAETARSATA